MSRRANTLKQTLRLTYTSRRLIASHLLENLCISREQTDDKGPTDLLLSAVIIEWQDGCFGFQVQRTVLGLISEVEKENYKLRW